MAQYIQILIRYCRVGVLPFLLLLAAGNSLAVTSATKSLTNWTYCYPYTATITLTCSISGSGISCSNVNNNHLACGQDMVSSSSAPENLVNVWFPSATVGTTNDNVCASSATARQYCWKIAYTVISGRNRSMSTSENRDNDNDFDGLDNTMDADDDNDGVLDVIDAAPLNAANSAEIILPLNNGYKGSQVRDSNGVE